MAFNLLILIIPFLGPLVAEEDPLSEYVHVPARYIAPIPANSILKDNTSPDRMSVNLCAAKCTLLFRTGNFPCYAFEYTPGSNMCIYTNITTLMLNAGYLSLKQNEAVHYYERPKGSFKNLFHGQPNTALKDQGSYFDIKRNVTVEQCAHMCLLSTQTGCLSFSYSNQLTACGLSNKYHSNNAKTSAPIMATPLYDHYQFFTSWPCNAIIPMNYTPTAIASVRFPYQAVRNIQCYLKLEAPPGHKIEITFSTVYFGRDVCTESGDGIILHDGETAAAPVIGRFCDRTGSALKVKQSTANSLFVTYKTGSVPMAFKAVYQFVNPCKNHKCQNGAICNVTNRSYVCNCPHGWSGRFCEANIDDCVNEPCLFGGTCIDELNGYHCQCSREFSGNRCEKFLGKCAEHPCVHGACHVTSRYNYTCKCEKDYIGKNCDHKQQYCNPNPCVHGSCVETFGYYLCQCKNGYTGQNCNIPENPCKYRPCANGVCSLVNATYHCACSKGFSGRNCDIIDKCANMNCLHGKCVNMNNTLKCECDNGFTGSNCDVMINQCAKVNCFHGKCIKTNNTFSCECKEGWTGSTCETDIAIDPCDKAQCGIGLCEALHGSRMEYRCLCPNGYHGKNCQSRGVTNVVKLHTKSRPCEQVQCLNGGKCKDLNGKATCSCKAPFSGNFCEQKLKDCSFLPCLANATCVDTRLGHVCICPTGIVGQACDRVMSPCISNPCKTGICQESNNTYGYRCVLYTMTGHNNVTITSVIVPPNNKPTTDSVRWNLTSAAERHDVSCLSDSISVFIPSDLLSHYQTTWRDPHCQVQDNGTHYVSTISHTSCGTTVIFTKDEVIFENELILHKSGSPSNQTSNGSIDFGSSDSEVIPVQCIYPRRQNISTLYRPAQSTVRFYEKRYGHMDVQLEQYKSGMFVTPLPVRSFPNEVEINKDMYFILHAMHVNSKDVAVKVDSCVATPSNMPADGRIYQLLDQGCPASPAVKVYPSAFDEVRFSVRAFEFRTSPGGIVYIHCQVSVCSPTSPQCRVGCAHRHRREVSTEDGGSHLVSGGPYLLVADKGGLQVSTVVAGVCASVAVVATVIAIIGWRRKSSASTSSSKL